MKSQDDLATLRCTETLEGELLFSIQGLEEAPGVPAPVVPFPVAPAMFTRTHSAPHLNPGAAPRPGFLERLVWRVRWDAVDRFCTSVGGWFLTAAGLYLAYLAFEAVRWAVSR